MLRTRSITFTLPLLYRGAGLEIRATTQRHEGKPWWPKDGSTRGVTVVVLDGSTPRVVDFAMFHNDHEIMGGHVVVENGQVMSRGRRILPWIGDRSLFDVNIIPAFSRKEAAVV